jgi:predicted tellurium resistance membrane protein TerC
MEHAEHGFLSSIIGLVMGFVLSIVVSSVFPILFGDNGRNMAVLINFLSIIIGLIELERAKYWGLLYSLGYFFGLILIGRYLMESWEWIMYCLIIGIFMVQKVIRKARI